ncbi:polyphosphate kinase 2 [Leifsonia sp. LS1]|uniref:polyphosphate kinase 2 n=1 Tax=Leifsonia sp. LS1 TaxID=2828483 RepID=UPI001CFE9386|nr:polyphosphate kinase 2 [Leifsonia sp. LS1]GIT81339.1 polyphosphate kinase 2 [Leifsonia sp. LS1]
MARDRKASTPRIPLDLYEAELEKLQADLVQLQMWTKATGARVVILFEGRDAAGKGSAIKRITQYLSPRIARTVALPAPTERERGQWYFQRYVQHLPAEGEIVLFDRSWYNRAGVERVMGFCTDDEYERFLRQAPTFERMLVEDGVHLIKFWFSVSESVQHKRFRSRAVDPLRQWKLSPMDLESITRWDAYTAAKERMLADTDVPWARWVIVDSEDKRRSRLNSIAYILNTIPWEPIVTEQIEIPPRPEDGIRESSRLGRVVATDVAGELVAEHVAATDVHPYLPAPAKHAKGKKKSKRVSEAMAS